ncbi:MAG: hypothetical protein LBM25_00875 [Bacteroidales bacterium]|jgi:hypothetical protein|nr:hypothetical protein [Bacteroidales bacterium]
MKQYILIIFIFYSFLANAQEILNFYDEPFSERIVKIAEKTPFKIKSYEKEYYTENILYLNKKDTLIECFTFGETYDLDKIYKILQNESDIYIFEFYEDVAGGEYMLIVKIDPFEVFISEPYNMDNDDEGADIDYKSLNFSNNTINSLFYKTNKIKEVIHFKHYNDRYK